MRELPAVSEDFTREQLLLRMKFLGMHKPKYNRYVKDKLLNAIRLVENINTRTIEDGYQ